MYRTARCTHCGADLKLSKEVKVIRCDYCKTDLLFEQAVQFSLVSVDYSKEILNLRKLQSGYMESNDSRGLISVSERIIELVPDDYRSSYLLGYANQLEGNQNLLLNFFDSSFDAPISEKLFVVDHLMKHYDLRQYDKVKTFIESIEPQLAKSLKKQHEQRREQEQQYIIAGVDVFVCFSSKNQAIAERIVNVIEDEGLSCWIATRNLRPNDQQNYWDSIEQAIKRAKVVLVVSSEDAMLSRDVIKEIDIAIDNSKKLLEFKIDDSSHTTFFKYAFDGLQWIDGVDRLEQDYRPLINRVFYGLDILPKVKKKDQESKISSSLKQDSKRTITSNFSVKGLFKKWWFWTALGSIITVVLILFVTTYVPYRPEADFLENIRNEVEPNNTIQQADQIREGDTYFGTLSDFLDEDFYRYTERVFGRVRIILGIATPGVTTEDVIMALYDENGTLVSTGGEIGDLIALQISVTNSKTYYIYVTQSFGSTWEGPIDYYLYVGY